jgi:hypothetical protein
MLGEPEAALCVSEIGWVVVQLPKYSVAAVRARELAPRHGSVIMVHEFSTGWQESMRG